MPAWVRVLCPNVERLDTCLCTFAAQPERVSTSPASAPQGAPATCSRLQSLSWVVGEELRQQDKPLLALVRQQLAALPSLTHLHVDQWDFTALDQGGSALSTSLTRLVLARRGQPTLPQRLPAMFPRLRELELTWGSVTEDAELDGLLQHLRHVDVSFYHFNLTQSFAHRAWPWPHLKVSFLDVDSFTRLPLHSILSCSVEVHVLPSADAQAVARMADAVQRWGGVGQQQNGLVISGTSPDALVTTLGPLLAALPEQQRRHVRLYDFQEGAVTPAFLQRLGAALPACVKRLSLSTMGSSLSPAAKSALVASLPATVEQVDLEGNEFTEQELVDLCSAVTRRVKVTVSCLFVSEEKLAAVRARLVELSGGGLGDPLVTLVRQ